MTYRKNRSRMCSLLSVLVTASVVACSAPAFAQQQPSYSALRQHFIHPPADAKPMMRWWWFGPAVTKPELARELRQMKQGGIGGVEIQPVYPLTLDDPAHGLKNLPYLSPQFMDALHYATAQAHMLGLRTDITLGSGWPYGGSHTSLADAAARLRILKVLPPSSAKSITAPKLAEGETLLGAFLISTDAGNCLTTSTPLQSTGNTYALPHNASADSVAFFISSHTHQQVKRASVGAEGPVLDHFSTAAIQHHLRDVADPLLRNFSGTPTTVFSDSLEVYGSDWSPSVPQEFQQQHGYDLLSHLPEIAFGCSDAARNVRHDWGKTLTAMVDHNYLHQVTDYAHLHHTKFRSQTYGEPAASLSSQTYVDLPEGEGPQWRTFSFTRWATSANHLYGQPITSAETWTWLHSPAFRATPLDMKAEADRFFLIGINQFVGHGWPYSPPQAGEPGWSLYAAAVFNTHNPWWIVMPSISTYLQRTSYLLRQGQPANDVAILLPQDDAWAAFIPGHVSITDEMKKRITPSLMSQVLDAGYNLDYIDADAIDKLGINYPVLVIPPTDRIPADTYKKILAYAASGGHVISIGTTPHLAARGTDDAQGSQQIEQLSTELFGRDLKNTQHIASETTLGKALHTLYQPDLESSTHTTDLGFIHRKTADADIYFLANTGNKPLSTTATFHTAYTAGEQWNPETSDSTSASPTQLAMHLAPYESRIYIFHNSASSIPSASAQKSDSLLTTTDLDTNWTITFKGQTKATPIEIGTPWNSISGRQNYSGTATYRRTFTAPAHVGKHVLLSITGGETTIDTRPASAPGTHANFDPPIREAAVITVNGRAAGTLWHPPYQLDITPLLKPGQNTIAITVANTAINNLAGQPPRDYSALTAKYGERFVMQDMNNLQPIPSGITGKIQFVTAEKE